MLVVQVHRMTGDAHQHIAHPLVTTWTNELLVVVRSSMKYVVETGYCILGEFMWWRQVMNGLGLPVWSMNFYSYALQYLGRHVYCLESIVSWADQANWSWLSLYKGEAYCGSFLTLWNQRINEKTYLPKLLFLRFEKVDMMEYGHLCISLREGGRIIIRGQLDIHRFFKQTQMPMRCLCFPFDSKLMPIHLYKCSEAFNPIVQCSCCSLSCFIHSMNFGRQLILIFQIPLKVTSCIARYSVPEWNHFALMFSVIVFLDCHFKNTVSWLPFRFCFLFPRKRVIASDIKESVCRAPDTAFDGAFLSVICTYFTS